MLQIFDSQSNKALPYQDFTTEQTKNVFVNTVALNSDEDPKSNSGNPTEMALLKYLDYNDLNVVDYRKQFDKPLFQVPFNSSRKRMSKIVRDQTG